MILIFWNYRWMWWIYLIFGIVILVLSVYPEVAIWGIIPSVMMIAWGIWLFTRPKKDDTVARIKASIEAANKRIEYLDCPICKSETTLRTVLKGKDKGKKYYVCVNYPECKGRIKA